MGSKMQQPQYAQMQPVYAQPPQQYAQQQQQPRQQGKDTYNADVDVNGNNNIVNVNADGTPGFSAPYFGVGAAVGSNGHYPGDVQFAQKQHIPGPMGEEVEDFVDGSRPTGDGWYEAIMGATPPAHRFKWVWAIVAYAKVLAWALMWCLAMAWRIDDNSQRYYTLFDFYTDFSTTGIAPTLVVPQINVTTPQQTIYVASWLLGIASILLGMYIVMLIGNSIVIWWREGTFSVWRSLQGFHSSPGLYDQSFWLEMEDLWTTGFMWAIMLMAFDMRNLWFAISFIFYGFIVRSQSMTLDQVNAMTLEERRELVKLHDRDVEGLAANEVGFVRRVHSSPLIFSVAGTVLAWLVIWVYLAKFPSDPRPSYYLVMVILAFIFEMIQHVALPLIYYGIIFQRFSSRREQLGRAWDRYTYDAARTLCFLARVTVIVYCIRYGDTGHKWLPRIGL